MTPAQAALKWHVQQGVTPCFGNDTLAHIEENLQVQTAALMALVRGRSNVDSIDAMASVGHATAFSLRADLYDDWVESAATWSDGISRRGFSDH